MDDSVAEILPDVPFRVEIEVINKCNRACDYCYAAPFNSYVPPISLIKYYINKTQLEVRPFDVIFLGGEPFLRKDMIDILEFAHATFTTKQISVSTNGTVFKSMDGEKLGRLKKLSAHSAIIQVSIDSAINPALQKSVDSFNGARILQTNGIPFRVGIVLTQKNYGDYLQTIGLLLDFPLLKSLNLEPLQKISEGHFNENGLDSDQLRTVRESVETLVENKRRKDVYVVGITDTVTPDIKDFLRNRKDTGIEARNRKILMAGVYADGDVSMDGALGRHQVIGNILRQDWKSIWETAKKTYKREQTQTTTVTKSQNSTNTQRVTTATV